MLFPLLCIKVFRFNDYKCQDLFMGVHEWWYKSRTFSKIFPECSQSPRTLMLFGGWTYIIKLSWKMLPFLYLHNLQYQQQLNVLSAAISQSINKKKLTIRTVGTLTYVNHNVKLMSRCNKHKCESTWRKSEKDILEDTKEEQSNCENTAVSLECFCCF